MQFSVIYKQRCSQHILEPQSIGLATCKEYKDQNKFVDDSPYHFEKRQLYLG